MSGKKNQLSNSEMRKLLIAQAQATGVAPTGEPPLSAHAAQHMTLPPSGGGASLEDLFKEDEPEQVSTMAPGLTSGPSPQPTVSSEAAKDSIPSASAKTDQSAVQAFETGEPPQNIPVHLCDDSPYQPRLHYDETKLVELGTSMKEDGQQVDVFLRKMPNGRYQIISGHRRIRAARLVGLPTIWAKVKVLTDTQAKLFTWTANEGSEHLTDWERGVMFAEAQKEFGFSQSQLARHFICSQPRVNQCLGLLKLREPYHALLSKHPSLLNYRHAAMIRDLEGKHPDSLKSIEQAVEVLIGNEKGMSAEELRDHILSQVNPRQRAKPVDPDFILDRRGKRQVGIRSKEKEITLFLAPDADPDVDFEKLRAEVVEFLQGKFRTP